MWYPGNLFIYKAEVPWLSPPPRPWPGGSEWALRLSGTAAGIGWIPALLPCSASLPAASPQGLAQSRIQRWRKPGFSWGLLYVPGCLDGFRITMLAAEKKIMSLVKGCLSVYSLVLFSLTCDMCHWFLYLVQSTSNKQMHFYFIFFLAAPCGMWDLSSQTRDQTCAPCSGRAESTTGLPGKSQTDVFLKSSYQWISETNQLLKSFSP